MQVLDFEVKVTDIEFLYKCKSVCSFYDKELVSLIIVMMEVVGLKTGLAPTLLSCLTFEITVLQIRVSHKE